jgi:hypothetical protein
MWVDMEKATARRTCLGLSIHLVVVTIQYGLGAFRFASSSEIKSRGVLNAGLMDQVFALQWVQKNIAKFGGNPDRVTIADESVGGGSAMLHAIAQGGSLGTALFKNVYSSTLSRRECFQVQNLIMPSAHLGISLPPDSTELQRSDSYVALIRLCRKRWLPTSGNVFDCLVSKDSFTLQYGSNLVSTSSPIPHGDW